MMPRAEIISKKILYSVLKDEVKNFTDFLLRLNLFKESTSLRCEADYMRMLNLLIHTDHWSCLVTRVKRCVKRINGQAII